MNSEDLLFYTGQSEKASYKGMFEQRPGVSEDS